MAAFAAAPVSAQSRAAPTLNPGELLLEIDAGGASHMPADQAMLRVPLISRGGTSTEARQANEALGARLLSAARSAGIRDADARIVPASGTRWGFVGNEAYENFAAAAPDIQRTSVASTLLEIRLRDPSRFDALRAALERAGAEDVPDPDYSLEDDIAARRAAKADALRNARAEAEAYARTLGMRVVRIIRVSERGNASFGDSEGLQILYRQMMGAKSGRADDVETDVRISVDFALASGS
jgi:uncharacterized protein YggE